MILTEKIAEIEKLLEKTKNIEYRIINNTLGKNLILISGEKTESIVTELLKKYEKYIQEVIVEEKEEDYQSIKKEARKLFLILFGFGLAAYLVVNGISILQ